LIDSLICGEWKGDRANQRLQIRSNRSDTSNLLHQTCCMTYDQLQYNSIEKDEPGRLLSPATVERGDFFARPQIHRLTGVPPDPSSSVGRSGGGRAGDPRFSVVDSVGFVCSSAGGAMKEVGSPAVLLVQVCASFGGGARWSPAAELGGVPFRSLGSGDLFGAPPSSQFLRGGGSGLPILKPVMLKEDEAAARVGWRLHGVRGPATSRPPGLIFCSKA
jgi:hypothetical protein